MRRESECVLLSPVLPIFTYDFVSAFGVIVAGSGCVIIVSNYNTNEYWVADDDGEIGR